MHGFQMLVGAHQAWNQMQRYTDRFEGLLKIDQLRKGSAAAPLPPSPPRRMNSRMTGGKVFWLHCSHSEDRLNSIAVVLHVFDCHVHCRYCWQEQVSW